MRGASSREGSTISSRRPQSAAAKSAASATLRARTPTVSSVSESIFTPARGIVPKLGLYPTMPQNAAGRRIEPAVCEAKASGTMQSATAAKPSFRRRSARRVRRVVRIARRSRVKGRELRGDGLADDDRSRRPGRAQRRPRPQPAGAPRRSASHSWSACRRCRRCLSRRWAARAKGRPVAARRARAHAPSQPRRRHASTRARRIRARRCERGSRRGVPSR